MFIGFTEEFIEWLDQELNRVQQVHDTYYCLTCGQTGIHTHYKGEQR